MKTKIKRDELINEIVDFDLEHIDYATIWDMIKSGNIGYDSCNNEELIEHFKFYKDEFDLFEDYADEVEIID